MKLVDTDIHHREDDDDRAVSTPPRPEHRRVYTSLLVTVGVLVATVLTIYSVFPKRNDELLTVAIEDQQDSGEFELPAPSQAELAAWSLGVVGRKVPWPTGPNIEIVGARSLSILRRKAALARIRIGDVEVTMIAMKPRDATRRLHKKEQGGIVARAWRVSKIEMAVAGPAESFDAWSEVLRVP